MPSQGRLNTTSPIYVKADADNFTDPVVYTKTIDGCTAVDLAPGFSGMLYIPFDTLEAFSAKDVFDVNKDLSNLYIMFRLHSLIGYDVYVDDVQGYKLKDLVNVRWPGDANYTPLDDPMLKITSQKYVSPSQTAKKPDEITPVESKNSAALPIALVCIGVAVCAAGVATFAVIKKKKGTKS